MSSVQTNFTSIGTLGPSVPPSSLVLKLAITTSAIRYFIQSVTHAQILYFANYDLHHVEDGNDLAQRLERVVKNDEHLQLAYSKTIVGINPSYSVIPTGFNSIMEVNDGINAVQKITAFGMDIVFPLDMVLCNKISSLFRNSEIVHLNTSLLKVLPEYLDGHTDDSLFVNVDDEGHFDILHFSQDKQLQLMNRYDYKTETDFLYFILLCCEDLKVDREKVELTLIGDIDIQARKYGVCHPYFRNISFIKQPPHLYFSKAFDLFPKHYHFNLYNLNA